MKKKSEVIDIELSPQVFNYVAEEAHKRDITFNKMCNIILREEIKKYEEKEKAPRKSKKL